MPLSPEQARERPGKIGASMIATLFAPELRAMGESVRGTPFKLHHIMAGHLENPFAENEYVFWGNKLEGEIARGIAELEGKKVRKVTAYHHHPRIVGMGASPDFEELRSRRAGGPIPWEIKAVDAHQAAKWPAGEPPMSFLLQVQHQLACDPAMPPEGALGALIGGNSHKLFYFARHMATIAKIEDKVVEFWERVANDNPPEPDFLLDADVISRLYAGAVPDSVVDLSADDEFDDMCAEYLKATAMRAEGDDLASSIKARLTMTKLKTNERALGKSHKVVSVHVEGGVVSPKPYVKKDYRTWGVYPLKERNERRR